MGLIEDLCSSIGAIINPSGAAVDAYIEELVERKVKVGYQAGSEAYDNGATIAEVAAWNEYGTEHMPARPFMRQTIEDYAEDIIKRGQSEFKKEVATGSPSAQTTLNAMGTCVKGYIQKEIVEGDFEPNAPSTIRKKGSDKPLIDSGRMRQSVTYTIE